MAWSTGAAVEDLIPADGEKQASDRRYDMVMFNYRNVPEERRSSQRRFESEPEAPFAKFLISSTEVRNGR